MLWRRFGSSDGQRSPRKLLRAIVARYLDHPRHDLEPSRLRAVTEKWRSEPREDFLNRLWTNLRRLWMMLVVGAAYAYELRQSDQVVSTGRLTMEDQLAPGDELTVAGILASVTELRWVGGESRLLLEPVSSPSR